jgi:glycine/D-amino acid oxidase-like deaminating enzyme
MKFCIIGAGIIGTSSAVRLKKAFPEAEISLISQDFSPNTTSDGAGGFWQPHLIQDTPAELIK